VDRVPEHVSPQKRLTVDFTVRSAGLDLSDTVPLEFKHQVLKSLPTIHTGNTSDDKQPWNTGGIYSQGGRKVGLHSTDSDTGVLNTNRTGSVSKWAIPSPTCVCSKCATSGLTWCSTLVNWWDEYFSTAECYP
jgi:hypothetical protein